MTRRCALCRALALSLLALDAAGCPNPETCSARGSSASIAGVASYAVGARDGYSVTSTVTVDDYTEGCTYDGEEFPITFGGCTLWVALQQGPEAPSRYFPGNPDAYATIEPNQTCELSLVGGTAVIEVTTGTVSFAEDTSGVFLSGTVTSWSQGDGPTGELEWQLVGSGWPGGE